MNCLDCSGPTTHVAAVAVCHDCGAGVCADHAIIETKHLRGMVGLGMPVAVEPPARIIRCHTCTDANNAVRNAARSRRPRSHSTFNAT